MIVLINPASTSSPRKPQSMSVMTLGAILEGEFKYEIVDGNVEADVIARTPWSSKTIRRRGIERPAAGVSLPATETTGF
jgi:hypothetical protein